MVTLAGVPLEEGLFRLDPGAPSRAAARRLEALCLSKTCYETLPMLLTAQELRTVDVPLPLAGAAGATVTGVRSADGALVALPTPPRLWEAVAALGLGHAVGYLRLLQASLLCFDFGWLFVIVVVVVIC